MNKLMKITCFCVVVVVLSVITSCKKSDTATPNVLVSDPFSNGTVDRTMIVVVSDMHLGADLTYAECNNNIAPLTKLLQLIKVSKNVKELVIAGDLVDEWFIPATTNSYDGKDQSNFVQRVAIANKGIFDVFKDIILEGKITVTYVPGNHDLTITAANIELVLPGIKQARDLQQGLGTYTPTDFPALAIEHGHRYNFACAPDPISNKDIAPGSFLPSGYFFTRIAALSAYTGCKKAGDTLIKPIKNLKGDTSQQLAFLYWQGWVSLMSMFPVENKFDDKMIVTNINGFTKNYSINDLMPFQTTAGGFIDVNLYKGVQDQWELRQTANNVAVHFSAAQAIAEQDDNGKTDDQAKTQYFLNPASVARIVVFGHTHNAEVLSSTNYKGQKSIYANAGTWVDIKPEGWSTMNFLVITPQTATASSQTYVNLYNYVGEVATKMAVDSLRY